MEVFTIFLCIVICHAFGDLQRVEIGEDDLNVRDEEKGFHTPKVKEAVNLDQSHKSKDVQEIVHTMMSFAKPEEGDKRTIKETDEEEEKEEEEEENEEKEKEKVEKKVEDESSDDEEEDKEEEDEEEKAELEEEKEEQNEEDQEEEALEEEKQEKQEENKRKKRDLKKIEIKINRKRKMENKKETVRNNNKKKEFKKALIESKCKKKDIRKVLVEQKNKKKATKKVMVAPKNKKKEIKKVLLGPINRMKEYQRKKVEQKNKMAVKQYGKSRAQVGEDKGDKYVGINGSKIEFGRTEAPAGAAGYRQRDKEANAPPFCGKLDILMTPAQIKEMVDSHNNARRRERATDMLKLVWDETLAKVAQQKANTCAWEHSMLTDCKGRDLGQNLWVLRNSVGTYVSLNITRISFDWADERNDWDWSRMKCNAGKQCGHWQMLAGAKVWRLGCGLARCKRFWIQGAYRSRAIYSVCNYFPPKTMFERGPHCSNCAKSTSDMNEKGWTCENKLCVQCDPIKTKGCKTGKG